VNRPLSLRLYAAIAAFTNLAAPELLRRRVRRGKEDSSRLAERLGRASRPRPQGPLAWVHAVSVGEAISVLPMIARLRAARPDLAILLTTGTWASAEILATRLPDGVIHQFAPVDTPQAVGRFLAHWRPGLALFAESELWPNLILAAKASGARLALVSARITERSARNWRRAPRAAAAILRAFDLILAQDDDTDRRLTGLGGRVEGRLNLKEIAEPLPADPEALAALRAAVGGRPVILAASTHEGEEAMIAEAVAALPAPTPLLVIAPRHPARAEAIAHALALQPAARRSLGEPLCAQTRVYLADTLGELGLFYRLADICLLGGSLVPGIGGHNPLEAARLGCAIVSGPHVANAQAIYDAMSAAGCALPISGADDLAATLDHLLADAPAREALGRNAKAFAEERRGDWDAAWERISPMVPRA
jgi:3-deoxy-D-manno-octulosonic-acid transferase